MQVQASKDINLPSFTRKEKELPLKDWSFEKKKKHIWVLIIKSRQFEYPKAMVAVELAHTNTETLLFSPFLFLYIQSFTSSWQSLMSYKAPNLSLS